MEYLKKILRVGMAISVVGCVGVGFLLLCASDFVYKYVDLFGLGLKVFCGVLLGCAILYIVLYKRIGAKNEE